ncbi:MAG TPA: phosphate signaling complex protein PhoU [Fimbriimonadaceae bacterium]|nr:phosphate signaling complex protein PhoU [Fimbriimonadaceae bacterium]
MTDSENPRDAVQALQAIEHSLLEMASRAETMVSAAVDSLIHLDTAAARAVFEADTALDRLDLDLETQCLQLLAKTEAGVGIDLRFLGTAIKMSTDIERVGDLAVDIAKCGLKIEREMGATDTIDLPRIAGVARSMLRHAIEAYVKRDLTLVHRVAEEEEEVDALYRDLRGQLHDDMRRRPEGVVPASWMLLALHHVERIADHALNIAERVGFAITGRLEALGRRVE